MPVPRSASDNSRSTGTHDGRVCYGDVDCEPIIVPAAESQWGVQIPTEHIPSLYGDADAAFTCKLPVSALHDAFWQERYSVFQTGQYDQQLS